MIAFGAFRKIGGFQALRIISALTFLVGIASVAFADRIYLKSGDLIEGIVVGEEPDSVNIQVEDGYVFFKRDEIVNIERSTDDENRSLALRWRTARRGRIEFSKPKAPACGQFFSVSEVSKPEISANWFTNLHETIQSQLLAFPPTAVILNLGPIAHYRRKNPQLYVLAFYSILLLIITPIVALVQNAVLTWWNAEWRKRTKKDLSQS